MIDEGKVPSNEPARNAQKAHILTEGETTGRAVYKNLERVEGVCNGVQGGLNQNYEIDLQFSDRGQQSGDRAESLADDERN